MTTDYRKNVRISASAGTLSTLATMDGWETASEKNDGWFIVTDPAWRDDVQLAGDARVLEVTLTPIAKEFTNGPFHKPTP